ncbi:circumsporozoite protein-like isoform X1 [Galleria mellonella]|uniref:Circumsporozoite protein-like isoform X1 n=1 Tax=Galleria mellonella TaxID=7137 RepID=A0A6J1WEI3_GALME|nr:circumsporozoite protein-like isoform X1 [Galleria mellonella]
MNAVDRSNQTFTWFLIICILLPFIASESVKKTETEKPMTTEKKNEITPEIKSRFFDYSGPFNQLNPNFNQGSGGNSGTNYLQSPQYYPGDVQNGGFQQYPNQENFRPTQNQGFNPQSTNGLNQWQIQPGVQVGGNNPNSFPNQQIGNIRPDMNNQIQSQNPNQGILPPVSIGLHTQVRPNGWDQQQYLNQPQPIKDPNFRENQYPNQIYQRPFNNPGHNFPTGNGQINQYPFGHQGQNFNQEVNQYPNAGHQQMPNQYPNPVSHGGNSGGTLDDIPPQYNGSQNAILGKPVHIPTNTFSPDQIYFEDSTESPSQRQCVQDCPATPEYQPVCGSNNVTYFNAGKFVCARNCGIRVYVLRQGMCTRRPM